MSLLPSDPIPAANFLVRRLYQSVYSTADGEISAVSETENLSGDEWYWTDDNSKVLELFSHPEVWRRFPIETIEILRFVRSMCHGPFIFRRVSGPRLVLTDQAGTVSSYDHSLMKLKVDTSSGAVTAGVRFHDERSADYLTFAENYVEFIYRWRKFRVSVDGNNPQITKIETEKRLTIRRESSLSFKYLWRTVRLGQIIYTYSFDARSMLITVEAALELDAAIQVTDVVLTIGHKELRHCDFRRIVTDTTAQFFATEQDRRALRDGVDASYYSVRQDHLSGDSFALHTVPGGESRLSGIEAVRGPAGRLHWTVARYSFPGPHRGARLVTVEHKMLTAGGLYDRIDDYARLTREVAAGKTDGMIARDFSISYDYGVVINAFAKCFAACAAGAIPPDARIDTGELQNLVDTTLDTYFQIFVDRHEHQPNVIFSRELSFVVLAVVTMYRVTQSPDYLQRLRRLCDVLLEFEFRFDAIHNRPASGFLMRSDSPRLAFVDCHSAALLALTQAARYVSDPRLPAAIDRGLASYCVETCRFEGGIVDTIGALIVDSDGVRRTENAFWNFKVGLTLRFFAALRAAPDAGLQAVAARHRDRMELLEMIMRRQLEQSVSASDDGIEMRCSPLSRETNSESQPWIMLGLLGHPYD